MNITIFADASFCPKTKAAGWGAWAKANGWTQGRIFGAPFTTTPPHNNAAEVAALVNAVYSVRNSGSLTGMRAMYLQTDSFRALQLMRHYGLISTILQPPPHVGAGKIKSENIHAYEDRAIQLMVAIVEQTDIRVAGKYVPGHKKGDGRFWVNRQCDREARKHMAAMREELMLSPNPL